MSSSNSYIFIGIVQEAGGEASPCPSCLDDAEAISAAIDAGIDQGADLVLLNAGSSAGSHDLFRRRSSPDKGDC